MELPVHDLQGKTVGEVSLHPTLWEGPVNISILSQALAMYRNNSRVHTADTKTRSEVSGGGKKPWRQKHTGRARAGSIRSPLWRGGGITFGPHPRNTHYQLPQAIRIKALLESLKGKMRDEEFVVVDRLSAQLPKTKPFSSLAKVFQVSRKSLLVLDDSSPALIKSLRNLAAFKLRSPENLNAFDVLNTHKLLVTQAALERIQNRLARIMNPTNSTKDTHPKDA